METHEAAQAAIASEENAPEGDNPNPRVLLLMQLEGMKLQLEALFSFVFVIYFSFSFFWWCRVCFWALDGNSGTIALYILIYIYIYHVLAFFTFDGCPYLLHELASIKLVYMIQVFVRGCILCFSSLIVYIYHLPSSMVCVQLWNLMT